MSDPCAASFARRLTGPLVLVLALAACSDPVAPEASASAGLFDDDPLLADAGMWRWVPTPGMRCRDGSATGFGIRTVPDSRDLLILLQGGGACFDSLSCSLNRDHFDITDFYALAAATGDIGAFDLSRPENPFRDWNMLWVPYCTGDFHGGDAPDTQVPGVPGTQDFVGLRNLNALFRHIPSSVREAGHVVLAGESAGGFGSILTYGLVAERLAPAPVDLLDDSGPLPPDDDVLSPSFQELVTQLWNLTAAAPPGCTECAQPDGLEHFLPFYASANPARSFGLVAFRWDAALRWFFGGVGAQTYEDALFGIRATLPANAGTYYVEGYDHLFLLTDRFYTTSVDGLPLTDWVAAFLAGEVIDVPAAPQLVVRDAAHP